MCRDCWWPFPSMTFWPHRKKKIKIWLFSHYSSTLLKPCIAMTVFIEFKIQSQHYFDIDWWIKSNHHFHQCHCFDGWMQERCNSIADVSLALTHRFDDTYCIVRLVVYDCLGTCKTGSDVAGDVCDCLGHCQTGSDIAGDVCDCLGHCQTGSDIAGDICDCLSPRSHCGE